MVRFSWKEERPYPIPSDRTELGPLEGVRAKRRKSFIYKIWRSVMHGLVRDSLFSRMC